MLHFVYRGKLISTCIFPCLLYNFSKISDANINPPSIPEFHDNQHVRPYVSHGCTWNYMYKCSNMLSVLPTHTCHSSTTLVSTVMAIWVITSDNRLPLQHI